MHGKPKDKILPLSAQKHSLIWNIESVNAENSLFGTALMMKCIQFLNKNEAILQEGIFRKSGDKKTVDSLKAKINEDTLDSFQFKDDEDIHNVCGLMKAYFREMTEPILTFDHYEMFIAVDNMGEGLKLPSLRFVLSEIPAYSKTVLQSLFQFLNEVMQESSVNKMTSDNLAIVFAPNLLRPRSSDMMTILNDSGHAKAVVALMINEADSLFLEESALSNDKKKKVRNAFTVVYGTQRIHGEKAIRQSMKEIQDRFDLSEKDIEEKIQHEFHLYTLGKSKHFGEKQTSPSSNTLHNFFLESRAPTKQQQQSAPDQPKNMGNHRSPRTSSSDLRHFALRRRGSFCERRTSSSGTTDDQPQPQPQTRPFPPTVKRRSLSLSSIPTSSSTYNLNVTKDNGDTVLSMNNEDMKSASPCINPPPETKGNSLELNSSPPSPPSIDGNSNSESVSKDTHPHSPDFTSTPVSGTCSPSVSFSSSEASTSTHTEESFINHNPVTTSEIEKQQHNVILPHDVASIEESLCIVVEHFGSKSTLSRPERPVATAPNLPLGLERTKEFLNPNPAAGGEGKLEVYKILSSSSPHPTKRNFPEKSTAPERPSAPTPPSQHHHHDSPSPPDPSLLHPVGRQIATSDKTRNHHACVLNLGLRLSSHKETHEEAPKSPTSPKRPNFHNTTETPKK